MRLELENMQKLLDFLYKDEKYAVNKRKVKHLEKTDVHKFVNATSFEEHQQIFEETRRVFTLFAKVLRKTKKNLEILKNPRL